MKKIITLLSFCLCAGIAIFAAIDEPRDPKKKAADKYCAQMKDGLLRVVHDGQVLTQDVILENGTKIKVDGTIIRKDGTQYVLKEGECVNVEGRNNEEPVKEKKKTNLKN